MGGNHMNEFFRKKRDIPTHDPQTGEVNPYYEELTGKESPKYKGVVTNETDLEKLDRFLITVSESKVDIRRKILMLNKFIEALGKKED